MTEPAMSLRAEYTDVHAELQSILAAMDDLVIIFDRDGRYLRMPHTGASAHHRRAESLLGRTVRDVLSPETAALVMRTIDQALTRRDSVSVTYPFELPGESRWYRATVRPLDEDSVIWLTRDITRERETEEALRRSEEQYRLTFDCNPAPMWVFDPATLRFLMVNDAAVRRYGWSREEFLRMTIMDIRPMEDAVSMERAPIPYTGKFNQGGFRHLTRSGQVVHVNIAADDVPYEGRRARLVIVTDLTERQVLEEQLRQSQRMEAVGQLAGGVAHDFNNLLTIVGAHLEFLAEALPAGSQAQQDLEEIRHATTRAAALTRQLLAFGRKQLLRPAMVDMNECVESTARMLSRVLGDDIELVTRLDADTWPVHADRAQLDQVIMNLAVNARDAMPDGGTLTIETRNTSVARERELNHHLGVPDGDYVALDVVDTGTGMSAAQQLHIFEPFFTTKPQGRGTGLGLSTVYGIVKQSNGHIFVASEEGRGAAFHILLPRAFAELDGASRSDDAGAPARGTETILVAEDSPPLRALTRRILERAGYRVIDCMDGQEALEAAEHFDGHIDLVLTDACMPRMGGAELVRAIELSRPGIAVLYMSGHTNDEMIRRGLMEASAQLLSKPFEPKELLRQVRRRLDQVKTSR